jgi:hypothetical protein
MRQVFGLKRLLDIIKFAAFEIAFPTLFTVAQAVKVISARIRGARLL